METEKTTLLELAHELFESWNESLQTKNPAKVAKLYRDDCVFLPTFPDEGKEVVGKDGVEDYFEHFLKKDPFGMIISEVVEEFSEKAFSHAGKYNFEVGPKDNRTVVNAKFTFIWRCDGKGDWGIYLHDSSPLKNI